LPSGSRHFPQSDSPPPLPAGLLADLARRGPLLVMLDYDGTLAEITRDPEQAWPLDGVRKLLPALIARPDCLAVAIVSGRDLGRLERLLGVSDGLFLAGCHGMELRRPDGSRAFTLEAEQYAPDLDKVRDWLRSNVPKDAGFVVEDKQLAITLHFRNAEPVRAEALRRRFRDFVAREAVGLRILSGTMIDEAIPRDASKGHAVEAIWRAVGGSFRPVYFGDDQTDEEAFAALAGRGIAILVGAARKTLARYRVSGPRQVLDAITELASVIR
jgi:trehalose-phosphatase